MENSTSKKILILNGSPEISREYSYYLNSKGWESRAILRSDELFQQLGHFNPNLLLLDDPLGYSNGLSHLTRLRDNSNFSALPVIMISHVTDDNSRAQALNSGADDIISKSSSLVFLEAKIRSILRRNTTTSPSNTLSYGQILLNLATQEVSLFGSPVHLTSTEFKILVELISKKGSLVKRDYLIKKSLSSRNKGPRTVDVHLASLRKKLGPSISNKLNTVRGHGYMLFA